MASVIMIKNIGITIIKIKNILTITQNMKRTKTMEIETVEDIIIIKVQIGVIMEIDRIIINESKVVI